MIDPQPFVYFSLENSSPENLNDLIYRRGVSEKSENVAPFSFKNIPRGGFFIIDVSGWHTSGLFFRRSEKNDFIDGRKKKWEENPGVGGGKVEFRYFSPGDKIRSL